MNSASHSKRHTSHQRSCRCEYTFAAHPLQPKVISPGCLRPRGATRWSVFSSVSSPWRMGMWPPRRSAHIEASLCSSRVRGGDACAHDCTLCDDVAVISEFFTPIMRNTRPTTVFGNQRVRHPIKHFANRLQIRCTPSAVCIQFFLDRLSFHRILTDSSRHKKTPEKQTKQVKSR